MRFSRVRVVDVEPSADRALALLVCAERVLVLELFQGPVDDKRYTFP